MKLFVMSDSHGNVDFVRAVLQVAKESRADWIIHLGDDSTDMIGFSSQNTISIPGIYETSYSDEKVKNRILKELGGLRILATHTRTSNVNDLPDDMKPEELVANREVDIVLFGHTHVYSVEMENGVLFINPGHLKTEDKKGRPATYAVLDIEGRNVGVRIVGVDGKQHIEKSFSL